MQTWNRITNLHVLPKLCSGQWLESLFHYVFFLCSYHGRRTSNQWDLWIKSKQCRGTLHGPSLNGQKWSLMLFDSWGTAHAWRTFEQQHNARAPAFRAPSTIVAWSKDRPALGSDHCHHHHLSRAACPPKPLVYCAGASRVQRRLKLPYKCTLFQRERNVPENRTRETYP